MRSGAFCLIWSDFSSVFYIFNPTCVEYIYECLFKDILMKRKLYNTNMYKYHKCHKWSYCWNQFSVYHDLYPDWSTCICMVLLLLLIGAFSRDYLPFLQLHWDTADYWFLWPHCVGVGHQLRQVSRPVIFYGALISSINCS